MGSAEQIAELYAKVGIKLDLGGLKQLQTQLKAAQKQAEATGKAIDKALKRTGAGRNQSLAAVQRAQTKQQFAAQLQGARLHKITEQSAGAALRTQEQQVKLKIQEQRLASNIARSQQQAAKATLQAQAQQLGNQLKELNIVNRVAQAKQRSEAHTIRQQLAQHRLARAEAGANRSGYAGKTGAQRGGGLAGFGASAVHRMGGFGHGATSGLVSGGLQSALANLSSNAGRSASALGAIAGPAVLVVAAFGAVTAAAYGFAREAERAANTRGARLGQFESVGDQSVANAERMNARFENFAQTEGLSTKEIGTDYAKLVGALSSRVGVDAAADTTEGILRFGRSQHLTNDNMQRVSVGLRQALGKGQLFSEEWTGQIAEHLGPRANEFGAEAWQRATGGNLTGQAASTAFAKDREDRKISGDALIRFMTSLGQILDSHANDGGLLDKARQTQEANDNRLANQYQANLARAFIDSGLRESMPSLSGDFADLMKQLQPLFVGAGNAANFFVTGLSSMVTFLTEAAQWFASDSTMFDPTFTKQLGDSLDMLGNSLLTLWNAVAVSMGSDELDSIGTAFKLVSNIVIGSIIGVIDVFSLLVRGVVQVVRAIQDAYYNLPFINSDQDKYKQILAQRAVDDKKQQDIYDERFGKRESAVPEPVVQATPTGVDPTAPWRLTDQSDIPLIPQAMVNPPLTSLQQPAVSNMVTNNSSSNVVVNVTVGDTNITANNGDTSELQQHTDRLISQFRDEISKSMSPPTNLSRQRSN